MASRLTDDLLRSDRLIKRRYIQIPKDQQAQLDNAWSETLSHGPNPMFNLPASVLEDVKDLHTRIYAKSTQQPASSAQRPSTAGSTALPPRIISQEQPTSSPQHDDDEELPWSSSPVHHLRARSELQLPSPIPLEPSSPPKSTLKRKFPPQHINSDPQSSSAMSDGLEIEPPGHMTEVVERPVNRTSLRVITTASGKLEPTPPSAQMPLGTGERVTDQPAAKRRRVTEDIHLSSVDQEPVEPLAASKLSQKPDSNQNSLATTTSVSSPSLGMQFARKKGPRSGEPKVMSDPTPFASLTPTFEGRQRETAAEAQPLVITGTPLPGASFVPPPAQRNIVDKMLSNTQTPPQQPLQHPQAAPRTSYETFKVAYPDYSRGSRDFVIALLSLKQLRRDRALHEFLYDDFIRAYSSDYFAYVSECSRKHVNQILPGIQWYHQNQNVEDVLYTKGCVRKNNLADFLDVHAKEAHSIRRTLEDSQSTDSAAEDSDENMEDALDEGEQRDHSNPGPELIELNHDDAESRASPELYIQSPGLVTGSSQLHKETPARLDKATEAAYVVGDVQQDDAEMSDPDEEDVQKPLLSAGDHRRAPESHVESPSAARVSVSSNGWHDTRARKSPTPNTAESFASQDNDSRFLRPIWSSSPERPTSSRTHVKGQTQKRPQASPSQRAAKSSAPSSPRSLRAGHKVNEGEDAVKSRKSPPRQPAATRLSPKRSGLGSADKDIGDDNAFTFEPPVSPPQRTVRPSSTSKPRPLSVDDEHGGAASGPSKPQPQRANGPLSTSKPRNVAAQETENDPFELPMSPLVKASPKPASKRFSVGEEDDTDEDDAFDPPPPPEKIARRFPVPKSTPIASTATARPTSSAIIPALKPPALAQSSVTGPKKAVARVSNAPSASLGTGRRTSAESSVASSNNVTSSKKRSSETPEQRSLRLKAFMKAQMDKKKRLASGTPASTSASKG